MAGIQRLGMHAELSEKHGLKGDAIWTMIAAAVLITIPAVLAATVHTAFLFVTLGPIIFQLIERPLAPASSPRNTIIGNALALLVGYAALVTFGIVHEPSVVEAGVTATRVVAVIVGLAVAGGLTALVGAVHPPAGSTLLLVALGIMRQPLELAIVFSGVVLICICAYVLNHIAGIPMPAWSARKQT